MTIGIEVMITSCWVFLEKLKDRQEPGVMYRVRQSCAISFLKDGFEIIFQ